MTNATGTPCPFTPSPYTVKVFSELSSADVLRISEATAREDNEAIAKHGGNLYPGVRERVPELAALLPLMIVSNCQRGYIEVFLEQSGFGVASVSMLTATLSADHRAVDGVDASRFLETFKQALEDAESLLPEPNDLKEAMS